MSSETKNSHAMEHWLRIQAAEAIKRAMEAGSPYNFDDMSEEEEDAFLSLVPDGASNKAKAVRDIQLNMAAGALSLAMKFHRRAVSENPSPTSLLKVIEQQREWSQSVFGGGARTVGIVEHIRKELDEILEAPTDLEEWIDVVLLGLDGAWRAGYSDEQIQEMLLNKQSKNRQRKWKVGSQNEPCEHIQE